MNSRSLALFLVSGLCAAMPTRAAAQSFTNGTFNSSLAGWTVVNTSNGTGAPGSVTAIDIDGPGPLIASNAATFAAGQAVFQPGVQQGVEMTQSLALVAETEGAFRLIGEVADQCRLTFECLAARGRAAAEDLAADLSWPLEQVQAALAELETRRCIVEDAGHYLPPHAA